MNLKIFKIFLFSGLVCIFFTSFVYAGACGTAINNPPSSTPPSWDCPLCANCSEAVRGGPATRSGNYWVWTCGTTQCSAPWGMPGTCDPAYNEKVLTSTPANYCINDTTYSALPVSYDHNWNWQCLGLNGASNATCYAEQNLCGSANGGTYSSAPSSGLCASGGDASAVSINPTQYIWTCSSATTPSDYLCKANRTAGSNSSSCGSSNGANLSSAPTTNLCQSGYLDSPVTTNSSTYTWSCSNFSVVGPSDNFDGVAMSSDGHYQTVVAGTQSNPTNSGNIYVSNDYGATWTTKAPVVGVWTGIAMSSDGHYQTATPYNGSAYGSKIQIYVSSDYGQTWSPKGLAKAWHDVCMSSTGQYQLAGTLLDYFYLSTDYGNTWNAVTSLGTNASGFEGQCGISSTGQYMAVAGISRYIYVSNDYGVTWLSKGYINDSTKNISVNVSTDGKHMISTALGSQAYYSTSRNYGQTWTNTSGFDRATNLLLAMSSTGQKQLVGGSFSNDYGATWTDLGITNKNGDSAMSSTGQYQTVVVSGKIWRSTNYGGDNSSYCSANIVANGTCGGANGHVFLSTESAYTSTYNQCASGTPTVTTFPTPGTPATWVCNGINGGTNSTSCSASKNRKPIITNGTTSYSVTTSSTVNFTGFSASDPDGNSLTYAWACTNGGTFTNNAIVNPQYIAPSTARTDTCYLIVSDGYEGTLSSSVTVTVNSAVVNGACGTAATSYAYNASAFSGTMCSAGSGVTTPASPAFPAQGSSTTWTCGGSNGGSSSGTCTATRAAGPVNGACGTAAKSYTSSDTDFSGTMCSAGNGVTTPASPVFPAQGSSTTWTCGGSDGGASSGTCTATNNSTPLPKWQEK